MTGELWPLLLWIEYQNWKLSSKNALTDFLLCISERINFILMSAMRVLYESFHVQAKVNLVNVLYTNAIKWKETRLFELFGDLDRSDDSSATSLNNIKDIRCRKFSSRGDFCLLVFWMAAGKIFHTVLILENSACQMIAKKSMGNDWWWIMWAFCFVASINDL